MAPGLYRLRESQIPEGACRLRVSLISERFNSNQREWTMRRPFLQAPGTLPLGPLLARKQ
jgi:hypothetical protein